jgi:hypothetical protein
VKNVLETALEVDGTDLGHKPEAITTPMTITIVMEIPLAANTCLTLAIIQAAGRTLVIPVRIPKRCVLAAITQVMGEDLQTVIGPVKQLLNVRYHNIQIFKSQVPKNTEWCEQSTHISNPSSG